MMMSRRIVSRALSRAVIGSAVLSLGVLGLSASEAAAAPSKAPSSTTGTFDCGGGVTGTFVVNSGNAQGTTWNPAHLTFDSGGTGLFHPTALDLTFTFEGQSYTQTSVKHNNKGTTTCSISASSNGFTLSGEVTGFITYNG